ncbi:37S ribosomal protein S22 [Marasmius crinis-equi]|uniref:37S ribosomal protein S22 n=1 Tax=Marasmius crinis-equi TaxID=585013 RepID=A0ABR3FPA4_9AGAR
MHCAARKAFNALLARECRQWRSFSLSKPARRQPNPSLELDPTLQALLKDVDISLAQHKTSDYLEPRELDILPLDQGRSEPVMGYSEEEVDWSSESLERKSPAAVFGSTRVGAMVLPIELQNSINILINDSDKSLLHTDAKRLFTEDQESSADGEWNTTYDTRYKSWKQTSRHAERDGTAFASVALPSHYSAIKSVLGHLKHRMDPDWKIQRVIDWGAGTGGGLWAALHTFQDNFTSDMEVLKASDASLTSYVGIEKRDGLVSIGKRLLRNIDTENTAVSFQRSFREENKTPRSIGHDTLALSAFNLSSLSTDIARKALVKEMWESGAHTLVLIDHNTKVGFESIAEARQVLLNMGRKETQDPETADWPIRGSHVVAPCPHDGECPLYGHGSTRFVCGFSQRLQAPSFVRHTKHSKVGHEDTGYSYVVVQRGERPPKSTTHSGRIGAVGMRQLAKQAQDSVPIKELSLHNEHEEPSAEPTHKHELAEISVAPETRSTAELDASFRKESFYWPRLVFPPLKKSGHIILDSCTAEGKYGKIMRLTVPKSQGKQPFYDARKSNWGDIFPHETKNKPQVRFPAGARDNNFRKGSDIGKRNDSFREKSKTSYEAVAESLKEVKGKSKRDRLARTESRRA